MIPEFGGFGFGLLGLFMFWCGGYFCCGLVLGWFWFGWWFVYFGDFGWG